MSFEPIPRQIINAGAVRGSANAYAVRREDRWVMTSWQDYVDQVTRDLFDMPMRRLPL